MDDLNFTQMLDMQKKLLAAHPHWTPHTPEFAKDSLLWAFEEMGEIVAILKKKGGQAVAEDPAVRACFLDEVSDVLMYLTDMLDCVGATPAEIATAYRDKHNYNLDRNWKEQNALLYSKNPKEE